MICSKSKPPARRSAVGQPPGSDDGRLGRENMIIGICMNGKKCVYDLPIKCETVEQFESLIYSYNNGRLAESQRIELYNQPKLLSLNGPMFFLFNGCSAIAPLSALPGKKCPLGQHQGPKPLYNHHSTIIRQSTNNTGLCLLCLLVAYSAIINNLSLPG